MNLRFLTTIEVASILKISKARAKLLIADGEIPSTRYHRRVIVKLADLNSYIAKKLSSKTVEAGTS